MPRYFFNIRYPGEFIRDRYGHHFSSLSAARQHALHLARERLRQGAHWEAATVLIESDGEEVDSVPFPACREVQTQDAPGQLRMASSA